MLDLWRSIKEEEEESNNVSLGFRGRDEVLDQFGLGQSKALHRRLGRLQDPFGRSDLSGNARGPFLTRPQGANFDPRGEFVPQG
jgi:hypothetical protein